jgi:hypothetical protein
LINIHCRKFPSLSPENIQKVEGKSILGIPAGGLTRTLLSVRARISPVSEDWSVESSLSDISISETFLLFY